MRKTLFIVMLTLSFIGGLFAQVNIQAGQNVTQNLDGLGTSATATLPAGWKADKNNSVRLVGAYSAAVTATERAGGNNMSSSAGNGIYNYGAGPADTAEDRAVGFISSSSATKSGNVYVQLTNNGSSAINSFTISYNVEKYRMGTNSAGFSIQMYYSNDGTTWTSAGSSFLTSFPADASNNGYASAPGATVPVSATLSYSLSAGSSLYLAWNYSVTNGSTTSNAQGLGIDDVSITAEGTASPTIVVNGTLTPFSTYTGTPSAHQTYTLSGQNLTGNITVTAPTGFALSTDGTTYTGNLSLPATFNGTVYVRLTGATAGTFSGNIIHSSSGATNVNLAVEGTVTNPSPMIEITASLTDFSTLLGTPSPEQQYTVTGLFLTAGISVTAPTGYELSTDNTTYSNTLNLASSFSGTVYVRLTGATAGTFSGNIVHSSTGAETQNLAVNGTVTDPNAYNTYLAEEFNYTAGTTLTSNGWIAHSGAGSHPIIVADEGLVYPGYYAYQGLAAQTVFSGSAEDVHKTFANQTSGTFYVSFLFNASEAKTSADYFFHFGPNPISTDFKGRVFVQKDASNNLRFGISKANGISETAATPYNYALNTTYLIVMKYVIVSGTTNDEVYMWVNPVIGQTEPAPQLTASDLTGADIAGIGAVAIRQANNTPIAKIDGIRVTNDWAKLWEGTPMETPAIHTSTTELDPLESIVNLPSDEIRDYTLWGTNILGGITVTAPNGFQVSTSQTEGWASSITVPADFNASIYVRMLASAIGEYEGNIVHTSAGAEPVNVRVTGEALPTPVTWNITANLTPFSAQAGTPSAVQSYTLSAPGAVDPIQITTTYPFELSSNGTSDWTTSLSLSYNYIGNVYVRMNASGAGTFNGLINHNTTYANEYQLSVSGTATPQPGMASDLFFSEYIEGSSNNKAIEIFNGTGGPIDLSNYKVCLFTNGSLTPTNTLNLTGTLNHSDVYVIAHASANADILALSDTTASVTFFNGNDALGLYKLGTTETLIDVIGTIGTDPGTINWPVAGIASATAEHTLIRKPSVTQGNLDWATSAGTNADDSQWVVYAIDYIADLGMHTFGNVVVKPTFNPPAGAYASSINVTISTTTPGAVIHYTTDGSEPTESSDIYSNPIPVSSDTTIKAKGYATGFSPSGIATAFYDFSENVATIAQLRAGTVGSAYRLTGEAVLTFQQANRNQKYIQDATAAIVIDDPNGIITTTYNLYDGITGIAGTLSLYSGLLQFVPLADPGAATSHNNTIVPVTRTLATITSADQAKLLKIYSVTLTPNITGVFAATAENITAMDASGTLIMRTFPGADYAGTTIPTDPVDIICLGGQYNDTMQFSPRFLADITPAAGILEAPLVNISQVAGTINLSWIAVNGATNYRIESADDPYGTWTTVTTTANLFYSGAAASKKFYRVIAIN
ncbi:MAG TPA: chitobiase/beta-hexosaminidase C-terminal domain-containing protein [Candidatus Cloacimonas sp.]|nr:chitobiase/beta-hexosaminidase C-terminal domain-containing protein [Candidatus Cloacimonas sp.]HPS60149.1 chitobiase/beta-hexosaminidase C-terminal domain-containing protein [Candidatus Cloacimonas sp.]